MTKQKSYIRVTHPPDYEDLRCCCFGVRRIENKYGKEQVMGLLWISGLCLLYILGLIMANTVIRILSAIPPDELIELHAVCNQLLSSANRNSTGELYCQLQKEFFERYNSIVLSSIFYMTSMGANIYLLGYLFCYILPMMMALIQNNYEDIVHRETKEDV